MKKKVLVFLGALLLTGSVLGTLVILNHQDVVFNSNLEALSVEEESTNCFVEYNFHLTKRCLRCYDCKWVWGKGITEGIGCTK